MQGILWSVEVGVFVVMSLPLRLASPLRQVLLRHGRGAWPFPAVRENVTSELVQTGRFMDLLSWLKKQLPYIV